LNRSRSNWRSEPLTARVAFARALGLALACMAALGLAACRAGDGDGLAAATDPRLPPVFHGDTNPERLSAWNILHVAQGRLQLTRDELAYDLNTPLFSDYAHKLRVVHVPKGKAGRYRAEESFEFPVGTIIAKTFYYPRAGDGAAKAVLKAEDRTAQRLAKGFALDEVRLIETRLLVRREHGWDALPYVWNEDQSDAVLRPTGAIEELTLIDAGGQGARAAQDFTYVVPNANQCKGCHATNARTRQIEPIGPKARHLNKSFAYRDGAMNQLEKWARAGILEGLPSDRQNWPRAALWGDEAAPLDLRARSYLDINCAHCHNRDGAADTSGLMLEAATPMGPKLGRCKLPIAAGGGTGDRPYDIWPGHPEQSIFVHRIASRDPAQMMPELGRALVHEEGVALIARWIEQLPGDCS